MSDVKRAAAKTFLTVSVAIFCGVSLQSVGLANAQSQKETAPVEFRFASKHSEYRVQEVPEYAPVSQGSPLEKPDTKYYDQVEKKRELAEYKRQVEENAKAAANERKEAERVAQKEAERASKVRAKETQTQVVNQQEFFSPETIQNQRLKNGYTQETYTTSQIKTVPMQTSIDSSQVNQAPIFHSPLTRSTVTKTQPIEFPGYKSPSMQTPQLSIPEMNMSTPQMQVPSMNVPSVNMPEMTMAVPTGHMPSLPNLGFSISEGASNIASHAASTSANLAKMGIVGSGLQTLSSSTAAVGSLNTTGVIVGGVLALGNEANDSTPSVQQMHFNNNDLNAEKYQYSRIPLENEFQNTLPNSHVAPNKTVGNAIEVLPGDTLFRLSERYRVALRALVETNDLAPPFALEVGTYIYLPPPNIHVVESGETLYSISRRYNVDTRSLANMNGLPKPWTIHPGEEINLPSLARDSLYANSASAPSLVSVNSNSSALDISSNTSLPVNGYANEVTQFGNATFSDQSNLSVDINIVEDPAKSVQRSREFGRFDETAPVIAQPIGSKIDLPGEAKGFVWPIQGEVLAPFGVNPKGLKNDGLNISAKAGTEIKAASDGYVVYAGSELPGFGFLVLINHGGGWVSAYAHAEELLVVEGQAIRQGQIIAKVGDTGSVDRPQLHFQLRKGKTPIDPSAHLSLKRAI